jgi:4-hydroxy-3-methylbut-2-enyl diphosphate reductase
MEVRTAKIGWCVGIERAYRLMNRQAVAAAGQPLYATHRCHQPHTNDDLDTLRRIERGDARLFAQYPALQTLEVLHDPAVLQEGDTLLLGFHGLPPDTRQDLSARGVEVRDYKCPFIARLEDTVERLVAEGFDLLIMGKRQNHHCQHAQEAAARHQRQCVVIQQPEDVETIPTQTGGQWALVGQVTGNTLLWQTVVQRVQQRGLAVHVHQTVCRDSYQRQEEAIDLARQADCCLVVDDSGAASQSLFEVLSAVHTRVHRLRWRDDGSWQAGFDQSWLTDASSVAVVGGILVPPWALEEVAAYIRGRV